MLADYAARLAALSRNCGGEGEEEQAEIRELVRLAQNNELTPEEQEALDSWLEAYAI